MIIVRVELWSARTGDKTELARMVIYNQGNGIPSKADYGGQTLRGRDSLALDRSFKTRNVSRTGRVVGHRRLRLHVWHLVAKMLTAMDYGAE